MRIFETYFNWLNIFKNLYDGIYNTLTVHTKFNVYYLINC